MEPPAATEMPAAFRPSTGTPAQWSAAFARVEEYLRAHRVHDRLHQIRLINRILNRAAIRHAADPSVEPTVFAAEEIEAEMDAWFLAVLGEREAPRHSIAVDGRVALLLSDGIEKWPQTVLAADVPVELIQAMRDSSMRAGPDMAVSSMVPRPIEFGPIPDAAGETLERMERWPILRVLILWLLFAGALVTLFRLTR